MLSRLGDFLTRHRRKFIVTGVVVGGTFVALKYAQRKLIEMQEKQARDFLDKSRRMQHFESTERTCNQVIIGMGTELMHAIIKECSTDDLLQQLRENPPNKLQLWEEMKIESFTRLTAFIYASSMLVVALRVQLNILGGYLYHDITSSTQNGGSPKISDDLKQHYLSLIRHFIHEGGVSALVRLIRSKVIAIMRQLPLTKPLSLADIEQLFWSIQMALNSEPSTDPCSKMCKYLLPSQLSDYNNGGPILHKMYNETLDLLESDDACSVCTNNICRGFSLAVDAIADNYRETLVSNGSFKSTKSDDSQTQHNEFVNVNSLQIALARVIPIVSGLTAKGFDGNKRPQNLATSLLTFYVICEKTKVLGANVYETFSSA